MHKTILTVASLVMIAGSTSIAKATDIPDLTGWGIQSMVSPTPSISTGGSAFYPIINKIPSDGSTDFSMLKIYDANGQTFPIVNQNGDGMVQGDVSRDGTFYASWSDSVPAMQISFILTGPMKVGHVNFASGSAVLDSGDKKVLNAVANTIVQSHLKGVYLVGHADRVGSYESNLAMSQKRVAAAQTYLKARLTTLGVTGVLINTQNMGDLMSKSKVNQASLADRRVDITLYPRI